MLPVESQSYAVVLRDKTAELEALRTLSEPNKAMILPCLVAASFLVKDQAKKRQVSREEYFDDHLARIAKSWGSRPAIFDTRFLKFDKTERQIDADILADFLNETIKYGCAVIPAIDLRTSELRRNVISQFWRKSGGGLAIRLTLSDLLDEKLVTSVHNLLVKSVAKPSECILILDLADANISDVDSFAAFEAEWVNRAQEIGLWKRIVVAATNFPEKNPAPPYGQIQVPRNEWLAWKRATEIDPRVGELAMFGDYGADNAHITFGASGFGAIPHYRYATRESWLVVRGGALSLDHDGTIQSVANRVLISGAFSGERFSFGDEIIAECARGLAKGNPTTWRTANMNHHMTRVTQDLADVLRIELPIRAMRKALQYSLFEKLELPR